MADRFPLILNTSANQIQEIGSGDQLDLSGVNIANAGIITAGNVTIGAATTDLVVTGDARITGILTIGTSSLKLDGPNNLVNVGTALTLGHTQGLQFHTQNLHSEGFEINQINLSGIATFNEARLGNSKRLKFGDDIDLQIYHFPAGSGNNYISAANNTGIVVSSQNVSLMNQNHSAYFFKGEAAGSIVYHNNTARVTTTSTGINVAGNNVVSGNVTAVDGTFSGNVSIGGTLTYEDVTNIDSIGIITARNGIDCNGDIDVDGHTNLDNVSVAGVSTFTGNADFSAGVDVTGTITATGEIRSQDDIRIQSVYPRFYLTDTDSNDDYSLINNNGSFLIYNDTANAFRLKIDGTTGQCAMNLRPTTDSTYNLGTNTLRWQNLFVDDITVTGVVTATSFVGALTGNATSADTVDVSGAGNANTEFYVTFADTNGAAKTIKIDDGIRYNASSNVLTASYFSGNGANLSGLNGSNIASGTVPVARIGTGTKNTTTFYRGDGTFQVVNTDLVSDTSPQLGGDLDCNNKVVTLNDSTGAGNNRLKIGNAGDLQIFHTSDDNYISGEVDGKDLYIRSRRDLHLVCGNNSGGYRNVIYADNNGTARLYHPASGAVRLNTTTTGIDVTGRIDLDDTTVQLSNNSANKLKITSPHGYVAIGPGNSSYCHLETDRANYYFNTSVSWNGDVKPYTTGKNLGTSSYRWANLYVTGIYANGVAYFGVSNNADAVVVQNSGGFKMCVGSGTGTGTVSMDARTWQTDKARLHKWTSPNLGGGSYGNYSEAWYDGGTYRHITSKSAGFEFDHHLIPETNNSKDLGTSSLRWRNVYTNDLNLSNEGGANEVDGTWGDFTIQEGESDLFLINNRSGKKYKFNLTEVV